MADENQVKSWLALDLLKEQDDEVELCERCGRIRLKSYRQK